MHADAQVQAAAGEALCIWARKSLNFSSTVGAECVPLRVRFRKPVLDWQRELSRNFKQKVLHATNTALKLMQQQNPAMFVAACVV